MPNLYVVLVPISQVSRYFKKLPVTLDNPQCWNPKIQCRLQSVSSSIASTLLYWFIDHVTLYAQRSGRVPTYNAVITPLS